MFPFRIIKCIRDCLKKAVSFWFIHSSQLTPYYSYSFSFTPFRFMLHLMYSVTVLCEINRLSDGHFVEGGTKKTATD